MIVELVIAALAVWRVSLMLVVEDGPLDVFRRLREAAGIMVYADGTVVSPATFVAGLLSCLWCMSIWAGMAATILLRPDDWRAWVLLPFAFSAVTVIIEEWRKG